MRKCGAKRRGKEMLMEKLDCKGQACPLPVVNAKKALAGMRCV